MKKYMNPMLQVVSINKNDIIATSGEGILNFGSDLETGTIQAGSADRFREDWDVY